MLDDTPKANVQAILHDLQQPQQQIPHTPVNVRYSTMISRAPERFTLYSILLSDDGEPECYDEAMQVDTKI